LLTFDFEEWEGRGRIYEADLYSKTKRVVDLLVERGLPATFFLDAETVVKYPNAVQLLLDGGFELALHSDRHFGGSNGSFADLDFATQQRDEQVQRMRNGVRMIRQVIPDFQSRGFRSPGLRWNEDLYVALRDMGYKYDSSQQDKFAFHPFVKNGIVVLPVNCGDYDSACYKTSAQHVVAVWKDNFLRASKAANGKAYTSYVLLAHPAVCGRRRYIGMLKAILGFMTWRRPEYLTCSELVGRYTVEDFHQPLANRNQSHHH
jgi:peptidoglycan/xylan/chitin deacetylase (PgdA/CDA1 family)